MARKIMPLRGFQAYGSIMIFTGRQFIALVAVVLLQPFSAGAETNVESAAVVWSAGPDIVMKEDNFFRARPLDSVIAEAAGDRNGPHDAAWDSASESLTPQHELSSLKAEILEDLINELQSQAADTRGQGL